LVPQTVLPFLYEEEKSASGMTALAALPTYLELAVVEGLRGSIEQHMNVRADGQGWTDSQMVTSTGVVECGWWQLRERLGHTGGRCWFC